MNRLRAQQSWPVLSNTDMGVAAIAASRSASSKTMHADLPPSSSETRVMLSAQVRMICAPVELSPVKLILLTRASATKRLPSVEPGPGSTDTHAGGTPASSSTSASMSAVMGVSEAGLTTTGLPHARAGATFHVVMSSGKFHGTIRPHTPTGSRSATSSPSSCTGMTWP